MDRFKYRGKRVDNGEWVYGSLIDNFIFTKFPDIELNKDYWEDSYGYPPSSDDFHLTNDFEVIPSTIGQCTGHKDKTGKLIYEGDIVRFYRIDGSFFDCRVYWGEGRLQWTFKVAKSKCQYADWREFGNQNIEIIGNIHDGVKG